MTVYPKRGIPTIYNCVLFRSRLEAKWAAFFDEIDWDWEYEPFDLDGWIPDFQLYSANNVLLVDVKPIMGHQALYERALELTKFVRRIEGKGAILCVGTAPCPPPNSLDCNTYLGEALWDLGPTSEDGTYEPDSAALFRCLSCGHVSANSIICSFQCVRCGSWDGHHHCGTFHSHECQAAWGYACNRTQWKSPQ